MRLWLVNPHERLPIRENKGQRLGRMAHIAEVARSRGHEITWWASTFRHREKRFYRTVDAVVEVLPGLSVRMIHAGGYRRNRSLARLRYLSVLACKFRAQARETTDQPDVILASFPPVELAYEAAIYGRNNQIPSVLDVRDVWPDALVFNAPGALQPVVQRLLAHMRRQAGAAFRNAHAIVGITDPFVDWALSLAGRGRAAHDRAFPFSYTGQSPTMQEVADAEAFWDDLGIRAGDPEFRVCFFGTIGSRTGIPAIIHAARVLGNEGRKVQFVICGEGEWRERYVRETVRDANILFPGWVNQSRILVLMARSHVGIDPLPDRWDFTHTINNKAVEYLSAGLPILVSPNKGVLHELVTQNECGLSYGYEDGAALARAVMQLMDHPDERRRMASNALELYERRFSPNLVYGAIVEFLEELSRTSPNLGHRS